MTQESLLELLDRHSSPYEEEQLHKAATIDFVRDHSDFYQRTNLLGQVTGSAWILSPGLESALLIHHRKLNMWFQPGGHVDEEDFSIADTAYREAMEETGLMGIKMVRDRIFDVDVHQIPERKDIPAHFHYDIRMLGIAENTSFEAQVEEISGIRWVNINNALSDRSHYQTVRRMLVKSLSISEFLCV